MSSAQKKEPRWTLLSKQVPWYGAGSGYYGMLPPALLAAGIEYELVTPRSGLAVRLAGKFWSWCNGLPARHQSIAFAEWSFLRRFGAGGGPGLILALEDNTPMLNLPRFAGGAPRRLIGVIHYPPELWTAPMLRALGNLRSALILYRADISFFERHVGEGRVQFVPHGVDIKAFSPAPRPAGKAPRFLLSGQFGRDFALMVEVFRRLRERHRDCALDVVGAHHAHAENAFRELAAMPGVTVHGTCSQTQLIELYRSATLMLLPLRACGANNALVEALACGVPVVATDTGGVQDYGGGEIFPVAPRGDAAGFIRAAESLLANEARRREVSGAARSFAERVLNWPDVAQQHGRAVRVLCGEGIGSTADWVASESK